MAPTVTSPTLPVCYTMSNGAGTDLEISLSQTAVLYPPHRVKHLLISELHFSSTHVSEFSEKYIKVFLRKKYVLSDTAV